MKGAPGGAKHNLIFAFDRCGKLILFLKIQVKDYIYTQGKKDV